MEAEQEAKEDAVRVFKAEQLLAAAAAVAKEE